MRLAFDIVCLNLTASLYIDKHEPSTHILHKFDMGDDWIRLCETQKLHDFPLLYLVHPNLTNATLLILHIDQVFPIKVEWHTILGEAHIIRSVLHEHVFF